ncbi:MAG: 4-alpha-glucanotransferase [Ferruginibacter sp.]
MVIHFYIKFRTQYGQSLAIQFSNPDNTEDIPVAEISLQYLNDEYWHGSFEPTADQQKQTIYYQYTLKEAGQVIQSDFWPNRSLNLKKIDIDKLNVFDDWQNIPFYQNVFNSRAFAKVFDEHRAKPKEASCKNPSHLFEVHTSYLPDDKVVCLLGSGKKLKDWDTEKPVLLKKKKNTWAVKLNLHKEKFPLEYKYGVYDTRLKTVQYFEDGPNRQLHQYAEKDNLAVLHQFADFKNFPWKGTGVNIQLSALKTENSWGIGDFSDINLLTDWSVNTGIKLIQLLPINDTTATHDRRDSYPYSAISAFALHPVFLNVQKLAVAASLELPDDLLEEVKKLNDLPTLDYDSVARIKYSVIAELYEKEKFSFKDDFAYFDFFDLNRHWLVPYAAFCYLRDKFKSADFSQWGEYAAYDEDKIQELVSPDKAHYDSVAIHYFTQYHLHLQLMDAVEYAHKNGIIIKGDLPIGVGRHSVDTWMNPALFHMDMQAGAPPDAFTVKGQNWSFPTYNWEMMQQNDYAWWRQRMEHMSNYFDAIRIDHVLGFFRIWSIPMDAVEGIFGRFMPALPMYADDIRRAGIHFSEERFCDPYFTDEIIHQLFGAHSLWVKENVIEGGKIRPEFNTQRKVEAYFKKNKLDASVQQGIFDLLGNLILLRDEKHAGQYHFRISMQDTTSFKHLSQHEQGVLNELYRQYFFEKQNDLWYRVAQTKLDAIQKSSDMLICAEDLGMVPDMVEDVLKSREILALQVQRMPKVSHESFSHPRNAPYLSVVTPSTHDMSTLREWWEEDRQTTQTFYNQLLGHYGDAPYYCEPWVSKEIILQHLHSPAMWSVFLLQDIMAMEEITRREKPSEERINIPADPNHYWNYRMHITLEFLLKQKDFSATLHSMISDTGRR